LPADVPTAITYEVSALTMGDQVHVRDLQVPAAVTITNDPDDLVCQVVQPRGMELPEEEAAEEAEVEEGEEGAAPAGTGEEAGGDEG
jgi:large subunit ribosomal protein L25